MRYNILFIWLIPILFLFSCKKDPKVATIDESNNCRNAPTYSHAAYPLPGPVQNAQPYFNPFNENQFVYVESDLLGNSSIVMYDLNTKTKSYLVTQASTFSDLQWGTNENWIVFVNNSDTGFYKMKPNGSGLTHIMSFNNHLSTPLLLEEDEFVAQSRPAEYTIKFDLNGNVLDTLSQGIPYKIGDIAFSLNNTMACADYSTPYWAISVRDVDNMNLKFIYIPHEDIYRWAQMYSVAWAPGGESVYFASHIDIQKVDIKSYTSSIIKEGCTDDHYGRLRISRDGRKIIAEAIHWYYQQGHAYYNTDLVIMDIDGKNEMKVLN